VAPERGEVAIADVPPQQTAASSATERPSFRSSLIKRYATLWQAGKHEQARSGAIAMEWRDARPDVVSVNGFGMTSSPPLPQPPQQTADPPPADATPDHSPSTEEKMSRSQAPPSILDRPLGRPASSSGGRGSSGSGDGVSLSAFAYLYSELVQYHQSRVASISELERRLESAGYGVGLRVLELLAYRAREVRLLWRSWAGWACLSTHGMNPLCDNMFVR